MTDPIQSVTSCMLAAGSRGQWFTTPEIVRALRRDYGLYCTGLDLMGWLRSLTQSGTHTLASRGRGGSSVREYRLYVTTKS